MNLTNARGAAGGYRGYHCHMISFDRNTLPASLWKNGGGQTREILRLPAGASLDDFDLRVSIAELTASGPFSAFPGVDRVIVLLDGAGVQMRSIDGTIDYRLDTPLAPFAFPGETSIDATLLGDASSDFNVMARRGRVRAETRIVRAAEDLAAAGCGVLFAVEGTWRVVSDGESVTLAPNRGVRWSGRGISWHVEPAEIIAGPQPGLIAVRAIVLTPATR